MRSSRYVIARTLRESRRAASAATSITPTEFLAQCLNLALLATTFGALALGIGAAGGRRAVVLAAGAVIRVLAYTADTFAAQLGAGWLAYLSPLHYYIGGEPLRNGFQWADAALLAAGAAVIVSASILRFNRRDLG